LTALTVTLKVREKVLTPPPTVPPSSVTVTVTVAVPLLFAAGAKLMEPVAFGLV
jgi:hypothetical protein